MWWCLICGSVPSTGPGLELSAFDLIGVTKGVPFEHGGPEPEHWIQAEPTVPFTAGQGAAEEESGPGRAAGHIPVLRLRPRCSRDKQCPGSRRKRVPTRVWETQASAPEEERVCVLRGGHHWWLRYCELYQLGGIGGKCLNLRLSSRINVNKVLDYSIV